MEFKNRKVSDYSIESTLNAGLVLVGNEVKSIHKKEVDISGGRCMLRMDDAGNLELWLTGVYIKKVDSDYSVKYEATRDRKLLLKKNEIQYLKQQHQKGRVLFPIRMFFKKKYKIEVGVGRLVKKGDKRDKELEKEHRREQNQEYEH